MDLYTNTQFDLSVRALIEGQGLFHFYGCGHYKVTTDVHQKIPVLWCLSGVLLGINGSARSIQPIICGGTHQSMRTSGCSDCCKKGSRSDKRQACLSTNRQSGSKGIFGKSRRNKVKRPIKKGLSNSRVFRCHTGGSNNQICENQPQFGGRSRISWEKVPRMASESPGVSQVEAETLVSDRSDGKQYIMSNGFIFYPGCNGQSGSGSGLFQSGVGLSNYVLFPTPCAHSNCTSKVSVGVGTGEGQDSSIDSPLLGSVNMVAHSSEPITQGSEEIEVQKTTDTGPNIRPVSNTCKSEQASTDGMGVMRSVLKSQGFSTFVSNQVQESITKSTQKKLQQLLERMV